MAKINLGDYMAYLQHKTEKNEEERLQKVFEKLDREKREQEAERKALADLFSESAKGLFKDK